MWLSVSVMFGPCEAHSVLLHMTLLKGALKPYLLHRFDLPNILTLSRLLLVASCCGG